MNSMAASRLPVVYLDQCHWITLARAAKAPDKINPAEEHKAADYILDLARRDRLILPLSMAHMTETAKAGNTPRRKHLADMMLSLYAGWHMRHPMAVQSLEVRRAISGETPVLLRNEIFNRRPGTPFLQYKPPDLQDSALPRWAQALIQSLSWRNAWHDVLRSGTYEDAELIAAADIGERWARSHQELSTYLSEHPANRDLCLVAVVRTIADLNLDLTGLVANDGTVVLDSGQRLSLDHLVQFFEQLPYVGRIMEMTHQRIRNAQDEWTAHDLNDMMYLSCAAAYADFVVAERKATHLLQQCASRTTAGAMVLPTLRDLRSRLGDI
jgi:hypothetical protein